jgi:WD40 repeat protein
MLKLLTCVHGHFWEVPQHSANGEVPDAAALRCPACGAPADELPLVDLPAEAEPAAPAPPPVPKPVPLLDANGYPVASGYEIVETLGKNKKGVLVYRAKQVLVNRVVLLKVVLARDDVGQLSWGALRGEANALAKIDHPNIPTIHEAGERDRQLFYNVLEYFDGVPLSEWTQGKPVPPAQAAKFVEAVARAVHAAHEQGVVHRGLKPSSVLVEADPNKPLDRYAFKVVDFGLAGRPVEGDINDVELQGKLPHYLSPEQAWGYARDIGPCTDVYALGVVLYELLTGRPPFRGERASEIIEQIRSRAPTAPRDVNRRVPADLDAICRKCLQKPPRKRYASALELAEDLRRYREGVPIKARETGAFPRLFKWVARRPAAACLVLLLFLMFVSTLAAYLAGAAQAEGDTYRYQAALLDANRARSEAAAARALADQARQREELAAYYHDLTRADYAVEKGRSQDAVTILTNLHNRYADGQRRWEWHYLLSRAQSQKPLTFTPKTGTGPVVAVALSPDGRLLAAASGDVNVQNQRMNVDVWTVGNQKLVQTFNNFPGPVHGLAFSPDGRSLAVVSTRKNGNQGQLDVFNMDTGLPAYQSVSFQTRTTSVAYSPDGKYLAVGGGTNVPILFQASDGRNTGRFFNANLGVGFADTQVAFTPDSQRLVVSVNGDPTVAVWDCPTGASLGSFFGHTQDVRTVSVADQDRIATGGSDKKVRIWGSRFQEVTPPLSFPTGNISRVLFSGDGKRLAVVVADAKAELHWYDGETFREILTVADFGTAAGAIALDREGRRLAVGSQKDVRVYVPR